MLLSPFLTALCSPHQADPAAQPSGQYVEARTASVFAGACHYNGELMSDGRERVSAWRFEGGAFAGVPLAGLAVAVLTVDERNLGLAPLARRSVLYLPEGATPSEHGALRGWLEATHATEIGALVAVRTLPLALAIGPESYDLQAGGVLALAGSPLPDRACCKMPFQVWYEPLEPLGGRLVGRDERFRVVEPLLERTFDRPGENAAFFGSFGR